MSTPAAAPAAPTTPAVTVTASAAPSDAARILALGKTFGRAAEAHASVLAGKSFDEFVRTLEAAPPAPADPPPAREIGLTPREVGRYSICRAIEGFAESRGPEREAGRRAAADMVEEYALANDGQLPTARQLYNFESAGDPPTPPAAATRTTPSVPRPQPPGILATYKAMKPGPEREKFRKENRAALEAVLAGPGTAPAAPDSDLWARYRAMPPGEERAAFRRKHWEALTAGDPSRN